MPRHSIKTEALKILIEQMDRAGDSVILRHGSIRKTYSNGADLLRPKNADQISVQNADPVVSRKIQLKLRHLMSSCTPDKYLPLMDDVIEDATSYLAVHLLQSQVIQICKCMKNVFVQCELWCDEILRRVSRPCCTCARHTSAQALIDLTEPEERVFVKPGTSKPYHGHEISLIQCPSKLNKLRSNKSERPNIQPCPAKKRTIECDKTTVSYLFHANECHRRDNNSNRGRVPGLFSNPVDSVPSFSSIKPVVFKSSSKEDTQPISNYEDSPDLERKGRETEASSPVSFYTPQSQSTDSQGRSTERPFWLSPTTMMAQLYTPVKRQQEPTSPVIKQATSIHISRRMASVKRGYNARAPIVTTDQMADWHSMMVSLMWNVQAWRNWIQENIDRALTSSHTGVMSEESWTTFQRQITIEALQWRQYNNFSRQLTLRLAQRYRDKNIISPTRGTVKTAAYMECQDEMLDIIDMFRRWTHWLTVVIRETDSFQPTSCNESEHNMRWRLFKKKVKEYSEDWKVYNLHLKLCWEQKYKRLIADWLPGWSSTEPVWVVSACGAVPGGAVAAGVYDGEVTWVARTTHRCNVVPAALLPSKHCCIVYSDGGVHQYTKYQVMCNAEVSWLACRAGAGGVCGAGQVRAVRAAPGVHVGRVLYRGSHLVGAVHAPCYRCHVVIFDRPFAFDCYELLVLSDDVHSSS
ncbi:uncharacterized protein LOC125077674 [Vanessa atalanta]|uniref:uncharacterized protein LOC125077674 n=1 Tax=Vanessa atalanta TaxID=42275 RepID=UPI001FCD4195|nr:uncharacterized protein LOC125077674 [Vanessa atalanta]